MKRILILIVIAIMSLIAGCKSTNTEWTATEIMQMRSAVQKQLAQFPKSQLSDIYKNFYQDRFGSEHLLVDTQSAIKYVVDEMESMGEAKYPQFDTIGWEHNFVRVSVDLVRTGKITAETLAKLFIQSAEHIDSAKCKNWRNEWKQIASICSEYKTQIDSFDLDRKTIDSLLAIYPKPALRHSQAYRDAYKPHYRIISKDLLGQIK